jgi:hypothetical protein
VQRKVAEVADVVEVQQKVVEVVDAVEVQQKAAEVLVAVVVVVVVAMEVVAAAEAAVVPALDGITTSAMNREAEVPLPLVLAGVRDAARTSSTPPRVD